jgi:protocatechuate 3,4-dioxygenase beta subunit
MRLMPRTRPKPERRRRLVRAGLGLVVLAAVIVLAWSAMARQRAARRATRVTAPVAQPTDVAGRVLAPDGSPITGADVLLVQRDVGGHGGDTVEAKTDAQGRFVFRRAWPAGVPYPPPNIIVHAAGYGLGADSPRRRGEVLQMTMHRPTALQLTLLGSDRRPAEGVAVTVAGLFGPSARLTVPGAVKQEFLRRTDAEGAVAIPGLPQGAMARVEIEDERFAHLESEGQIDLAQSPLTSAGPIVLLPAATISGRVTYHGTGRPAAGIAIGAQGIEQSEWGGAVTDADGRYTIKQLRPAAYNVAVSLDGKAAEQWTAVAHEAVPVTLGGRVTDVDFELIKGELITGKVIAGYTGEGIPGMWVGVYGPARPRSGAWVQSYLTRADGSYSLRVPPGPQYLYLQNEPPPGFRLKRNSYDIGVREGETTRIDFTLSGSPMAPIRGQVLDPDGKPAAGTEVIAVSPGDVPTGAGITTNRQGRFEMDPEDIVLFARRGRDATVKGYHVTRGGEVVLRLRRDAAASAAGRVVDARGNAVPNVAVQLLYLGASTKARGVSVSGTALTVTTGPDGGYVIPYLWPNQSYSVAVPDPTSAHGTVDRVDFHLGPGERKLLRPLRKP